MDLQLTEQDFINAQLLFDKFYQELLIKNQKKMNYIKPTPIKISTITLTGHIGDYVMGKFLYDRLPINDDIIYLECGKIYRGKKVKKETKYTKKEQSQKLDKRKLGRGKPLSNQISIGMRSKKNQHKNPVCMKIFKNGKIQLTGCKTVEEGYELYEKLYNYIQDLDKTFIIKNTKQCYTITPIKNMIKPENLQLKTEMINASYNLNFAVEQQSLNNILKEKFNDDEVFITYDSCVSSPAVRCYLKNMSEYDERKKKKKQPSCFIYRSGSCNIIVWKMDMLYKAYDFINEFIKENFEKIVFRELILK